MKEEGGIRQEGKGKENPSQKMYFSEKPSETASSSSCRNACVLYAFVACTNPALSSSLSLPSQWVRLKLVEDHDGVAYAIVVDVVTPIVVSCLGGPFALVCWYPPCPTRSRVRGAISCRTRTHWKPYHSCGTFGGEPYTLRQLSLV